MSLLALSIACRPSVLAVPIAATPSVLASDKLCSATIRASVTALIAVSLASSTAFTVPVLAVSMVSTASVLADAISVRAVRPASATCLATVSAATLLCQPAQLHLLQQPYSLQHSPPRSLPGRCSVYCLDRISKRMILFCVRMFLTSFGRARTVMRILYSVYLDFSSVKYTKA